MLSMPHTIRRLWLSRIADCTPGWVRRRTYAMERMADQTRLIVCLSTKTSQNRANNLEGGCVQSNNS